MDKPNNFEIVGHHAEFRPMGQVTLLQMIELVDTALAFALRRKVKKILVVTSALTGFEVPFLAVRYFFIQQWARTVDCRVRAAFVARREMIDYQKFGVTVAELIGFESDIFDREEAALAWLNKTQEAD